MADSGNDHARGGDSARRARAWRGLTWCATFISVLACVVCVCVGCALLVAGTWSVRHGVWISQSESVRFKIALASMPQSYWQSVVSEAFESRIGGPFLIEGTRVRVNPLQQGEVASRLANVCAPDELSDLLQNGYLRSQSIQVSWRTGPLVVVLVALVVVSVLVGVAVKLAWKKLTGMR